MYHSKESQKVVNLILQIFNSFMDPVQMCVDIEVHSLALPSGFNVFTKKSCTKTLTKITTYINMSHYLILTLTHNRLSTNDNQLYFRKHTYNRL